jgi:hypothetical protein
MTTSQFETMTIEEIAIHSKMTDINKFSNLLIYKTNNNGFTNYYVVKQINESEKAIQFQFVTDEVQGSTPISTEPILAKNILFALDDFENSIGECFWLPKSALKFKTENFRYGGNLIVNTKIFTKPFWLK